MNETLYIFNLILREELGEYLIDLEICSNLICYFLAITGFFTPLLLRSRMA